MAGLKNGATRSYVGISLLSFLWLNAHSQYILETKLKPNLIESYCHDHCGSEFGSITTSAQFENIQSLLDYNPKDGIFIGLKANPHPNYEWIDQSPFAFTEFNAWQDGFAHSFCMLMIIK